MNYGQVFVLHAESIMSARVELEGVLASFAWPGDGHSSVSHPPGRRGGGGRRVLGSACISQMLTAGGGVGALV